MNRQTVPTPTDLPWPHRIRNALLLSAYAEALAAPFDGKPLPEPGQVTAALLNADPAVHRPGGGSADMLTVARELACHRGSLDEQALAAAFNEAGSNGNDAAVRATPIGLLPRTAIGTIALLARRSATVTHTHLLARDGAAVHAAAVALAAHGQPYPAGDAGRFLTALAGHARALEFRAALGIVRTLVRHRAGPAETAATVGHDATALRSVPAALTAFLRYPEDPLAAIRHAILTGGHTRAIAAMTAALAGARNPAFRPPAGWVALADSTAIRAAAAALSEIEGVRPGPPA